MTSLLQIGLFLLPFACIYTAARATSRWVRVKNVVLAGVSAVLYLALYWPQVLISTFIAPASLLQMLNLISNLISPTFENTFLGLIWSLLLVANTVAATGTRIGEVLNSKKLLTVSFWIVTAYSVYTSFLMAGGWSLVLITIPTLTSALAWGRKAVETDKIV